MSVMLVVEVASSREDAWIETALPWPQKGPGVSRPPARTRGLKHRLEMIFYSPLVASSREDAWIETQ